MSLILPKKVSVFSKDNPLTPSMAKEATFQDIVDVWRSLDDMDELSRYDKNSKLSHFVQRSEDVHVSFYKYMHEFSSMFKTEEQVFIPNIPKNTDKTVDMNYLFNEKESTTAQWRDQEQEQEGVVKYDTDALLELLRYKKALADRMTTIDIYNAQCDIKKQLEMDKTEKNKTVIYQKLSKTFVKCTICVGSIIFASRYLNSITWQVPKSFVIGFVGGSAIMMSLSDFSYSKELDGLNRRVNVLNDLSRKIYQLQDRANTFRCMISDIIIDIQYVKTMENQGKYEETERLSHKLNRIKNQAKTNEELIKCAILEDNPFVLFRE